MIYFTNKDSITALLWTFTSSPGVGTAELGPPNWFCKGPLLTVERANPLSPPGSPLIVEDRQSVSNYSQMRWSLEINAAWPEFFMYDHAGAAFVAM
jgi:hypothetical protein